MTTASTKHAFASHTALSLFALTLLAATLAGCGGKATGSSNTAASGSTAVPDEITVDWAYYSPVSIAIKEFGWMQEEFSGEGVDVKWVLSLGSNKANEYSQSGTADFASTAGIAALMARANGIPIKTVYVYSKPEWTALVAPKNSSIRSIEDLKDKSIAATKGTDPWFFLIQALETKGLELSDVNVKHMQHPDGGTALSQGQVDAWAGLDPHMAEAELRDGARLFFRNPDFNTYGTLNALERFTQNYPQATQRVIEVYERGRRWVLENPDEAAQLLADASGVSLEVAKKQVRERTDLSNPLPGENVRSLLKKLAPILKRHDIVRPSVDLGKAADELLAPRFARAVIDTTAPYVIPGENVPVGQQHQRLSRSDSTQQSVTAKVSSR